MNKYIFSVIIPTYNRPDILRKTLECLEKQETDVPFEVIVVDDCSTLPLTDLGFGMGKRTDWKLLQNERNRGRAATRNRGIREAKGEFVLMLDDDIWASPGLLQAHYDGQNEIGGGVVVGAVPPGQGMRDTIWLRYLSDRYDRIAKRLQGAHIDYGLFFTGNVSVPLKVIKKVGLFDESFKDYSFEDTELGYRLFNAGVEFYHASDAIGYHQIAENLESICKKAFQMGRSAYLFVKLHPTEANNIQYNAIVMGPWRGKEIVKNLIKIILYSRPLRQLFKLIVFVAGLLKLNSIVNLSLPWVELQYRAEGRRSAYRDEKVAINN